MPDAYMREEGLKLALTLNEHQVRTGAGSKDADAILKDARKFAAFLADEDNKP